MHHSLSFLCVLGLSACHITLHDSITVDGERLPARHEEVLTLEEWPAEGLVIEAHQGAVRAERAAGPTTLTIVVHEQKPLEAHAHLEGGRLVARAPNGAPCAIGEVVLRTSAQVKGLVLGTGMGDVELHAVPVEGELRLLTGMGDVELHDAGEPRTIELSTGLGDIAASGARCARFSARTGMGNVSVQGLEAEEAELSSGLGDVDVERSKGGRLVASSGLGDVEVVASSFAASDLDTGLGQVRER